MAASLLAGRAARRVSSSDRIGAAAVAGVGGPFSLEFLGDRDMKSFSERSQQEFCCQITFFLAGLMLRCNQI